MSTIRNRVKEHITCRAGDLVPHPLNFRTHPANQQQALAESYEEIGFARSLLGYRMPDGRIQLIDGHLRASHDPEMEVLVEILDVTEDEAASLISLLLIGALAETDHKIHDQLREMTTTDSEALAGLWQATADDYRSLKNLKPPRRSRSFGATPGDCDVPQRTGPSEAPAPLSHGGPRMQSNHQLEVVAARIYERIRAFVKVETPQNAHIWVPWSELPRKAKRPYRSAARAVSCSLQRKFAH